MSCSQVQMTSPSLFPSPDPYRHRRCAKLYNQYIYILYAWYPQLNRSQRPKTHALASCRSRCCCAPGHMSPTTTSSDFCSSLKSPFLSFFNFRASKYESWKHPQGSSTHRGCGLSLPCSLLGFGGTKTTTRPQLSSTDGKTAKKRGFDEFLH